MEGFCIASATPVDRKRTAKIFVNSLKGIYHDKMLGNATKNFADMVVSGELIESSIKSGLVEDNSSSKKTGSGKKKEREAQAVYGEFQPNYTPYSFYPGYAPYYPSINNVAHNPYVYCRRQILSGLLCSFSFWASGPFVTSFEFGPRTLSFLFIYLFYWVFESFCISYLFCVYFRI